MTQKSTTRNHQAIGTQPLADWSQAYVTAAAALGTSWCDFVGERFHAYAHVIDDVSHCHDLNEAWKAQASFGQQTLKAYSEQAAKVGSLMMQAVKADGASAKH